jgi:hypothetical protein
MAPNGSESPDCARPVDDPTNGSPDSVSDIGPCEGDVPSEYALPAAAPPDKAVDGFLPDEPARVVLPHPRYPDPSSRMGKGPSEPAPPAARPIAGRVGSLFGLNPYSSTSFLRNSSAFLRCFRLLQNHRPSKAMRATETIGTTTATAVVPAVLSPPPPPFELPLFSEGAAVEELVGVEVVVGLGRVGAGMVLVSTVIIGDCVVGGNIIVLGAGV